MGARGRRVVFVVFDGVKLLDVVGPAEVFTAANQVGAGYQVGCVSASGEPVGTSVGVQLPARARADGVVEAETVVVCGGDALVPDPIPPDLVGAVRYLRPRADRLVSICTGSPNSSTRAGLPADRCFRAHGTENWEFTDNGLVRNAAPASTTWRSAEAQPRSDLGFRPDTGSNESSGWGAA